MQSDRNVSGILRNEPVDPYQWVAKYADYLYAYAISRIDNEELAKDLVQDTFLAALEGIDTFKGNSSEKTWLTSILKHKVIDVYRKRSSGLLMKENIGSTELWQQDFFNTESGHWKSNHMPIDFGLERQDLLENKELWGILLQCLQKLPALWLSVFTMKYMDDQSAEIICSALKITPSNYWVIIHRAKLNLRDCLQKNWI